jgi:hypothetical protein
MAETHHVKVLKKSEDIVTIALYILIPEITEFCISKSCALQILWDKAHPAFGKPGPLGEAITAEERLDFGWLDNNADRFIASVDLMETINYPPLPSFDFGKHRYDMSLAEGGCVLLSSTQVAEANDADRLS